MTDNIFLPFNDRSEQINRILRTYMLWFMRIFITDVGLVFDSPRFPPRRSRVLDWPVYRAVILPR